MVAAAMFALGYLFGSLPTGYIIGCFRGIDIRRWGSGATGGTNVLRTLGAPAAFITGVTDLLKGTAAAYLGYRLGGDWGYALGGLGAVAGHAWPVWLRFRGGRSVATGAGAALLMHPLGVLAGVAAGLVTVAATRYVSLGSLAGGAALGVAIGMIDAGAPHKWLTAGILAVIYVRHWENMKRLVAGTESKLGQKARELSGREQLQHGGRRCD